MVEKFAHCNKLKFSKVASERLRSGINSGSVPIILPLFLKEKETFMKKENIQALFKSFEDAVCMIDNTLIRYNDRRLASG